MTKRTLMRVPWKIKRAKFYADYVLASSIIYPLAQIERLKLARVRAENPGSGELPHNPLVTVTIATYNRADILIERTLPTILSQTYQNLEIIIVGDHCTDDTGERLSQIGDARIRFINLPQRGKYPTKSLRQWRVAGSIPLNVALNEAQGDWIAHIDDDDCHQPQHIEKMLRLCQRNSLELAYSRMRKQYGPSDWRVIGLPPPMAGRRGNGNVPHSNTFFRTYLRMFQFSVNSWRLGLPTDQHVWFRMRLAGVRVGFLDEVTVTSPLRPGTTLAHDLSEDRV